MSYPLEKQISKLSQLMSLDMEVIGSPKHALKSLMENEKSLTNTVRTLAWWKKDADIQKIEDIDNECVKWAVSAGFIDEKDAPVVMNTTERSILGTKRMPGAFLKSLSLEDKSTIYLATTKNGNISHHERMTDFFVKNLPEERIFVIFHELGHNIYDTIEDRFISDKLSPVSSHYLNDVVLKNETRLMKIQNEMFADSMGAIMLLEGTNFSDVSLKFIEGMIKRRRKTEEAMEARTLTKHVHYTSTILEEMLKRVDDWKGLSKEEQKDFVIKLSSEHLLKLINPKRKYKNALGQYSRAVGNVFLYPDPINNGALVLNWSRKSKVFKENGVFPEFEKECKLVTDAVSDTLEKNGVKFKGVQRETIGLKILDLSVYLSKNMKVLSQFNVKGKKLSKEEIQQIKEKEGSLVHLKEDEMILNRSELFMNEAIRSIKTFFITEMNVGHDLKMMKRASKRIVADIDYDKMKFNKNNMKYAYLRPYGKDVENDKEIIKKILKIK